VACALPLLKALAQPAFAGRLGLGTPEGWSVEVQ
jgi:hypothetical protein